LAGEVRLVVRREAAHAHDLRPGFREGRDHGPRAAGLHPGHGRGDTDLVVEPLAVAGGEDARIVVDLRARQRVADHREHSGRDLLVRQVRQLHAGERLLVEAQGGAAVKAIGHPERPEAGLGLARVAGIAARVLPRLHLPRVVGHDRACVRGVEKHRKPLSRQAGCERLVGERQQASSRHLVRRASGATPDHPAPRGSLQGPEVHPQHRCRLRGEPAGRERDAPLTRPLPLPYPGPIRDTPLQALDLLRRCATVVSALEHAVGVAVEGEYVAGGVAKRVLERDFRSVHLPPLVRRGQ